MRLVLALLLAFAGAACLVQRPPPDPKAPTSAHETRRSQYPDGTQRSEVRLLVWSDGRTARDGAEREWHRDGKLAAERYFAEDRQVGSWRTWYPDGTLRSDVDLGTGDGAPTVQRFWHPNGALAAEGPLREGKRDGRWRYLDVEGRIEREGGYRNGKRDGPWKFFREDGAVRAEGSYALGVRVGEWQLRDEQGTVHARSGSDADIDDQ